MPPNIQIAVPVNRPRRERDIITPATLKYALDLNRDDPEAEAFAADPAHRDEIVELYNAAVKDGRFVRLLATEPENVAQQLGMPLSAGAAESIKKVGSFPGATITDFPEGFDRRVAWVTVVAIAIVVIVAAQPDDAILDRSGVIKL